ncbi:class I SAM-dependent methyltransferase [Uruburuella testudinis]|uniref:Class I SAM-dependent methyltransferase n=1 Tax=Uruburuella testudinis TaxID=1282863 RepID=A0ABY4DW27_9NEIS|nr:class I SAM-dependent methyltransferase [Uruburuella testudinis]UOO83240.1 class I SAM-dependent methyltransferase [Uruburuella testudinis]
MMRWFAETEAGRYTAAREQQFFSKITQALYADVVVQTGMPDWPLWPSEQRICVGLDVQMAADESAWAEQSLDLLLMPHGLECGGRPYLALAEAYRALKPEGRLVLTGFNPHSLWRFSRRFDGSRLPEKKRCLPLPQLKRQAKSVGFAVEAGQFMVYVPAVNSRAALRRWRFMESAGDRWWPHAAAVYGLVLLKRRPGVHPLPEFERQAEKENGMVLGVACTGGKYK